MHITLETDYAIRMTRSLMKAGGRVDARRLSEEADVTLRFALKILGKLVSAGIARSYKGTQGGYELARGPEAITIYDVMVAVEGPYNLSRCLAEGYNCPRNGDDGLCRVHEVFAEVTKLVRERLSAVTFDRL